MRFAHISSNENIADVSTKPLPNKTFHYLVKKYLFRQPLSLEAGKQLESWDNKRRRKKKKKKKEKKKRRKLKNKKKKKTKQENHRKIRTEKKSEKHRKIRRIAC